MRADPRLKQKRATRWRKERQERAFAKFKKLFPKHATKNYNVPFQMLHPKAKQFIVEKFG